MRLTLTFMTPMLPDDLDVLSRPVTYVTWEAASTDGKPHEVSAILATRRRRRGEHAGPDGRRAARERSAT